MNNKQTDLLHGSIWRGLIAFAMPILLGQVFQQLYNTADAWIVGHYLNNDQYGAVTSTSSLVFLLVGFFSGISVGAGVVIARYFGAGDAKNLRASVHTTLVFGFAAGVFLTVFGVACTPWLLRVMGTPKSIIRYSVEYFRFYFAGALGVVMYNLCMGILQAVGDSKHPLYYLIFSSVTNVALDFLFVGGFGWGVWSAALATSISQFVSVFLCMYRLMHYETVYQVKLPELRVQLPMLRQIIHLGLPAGMQNSIIAFANVIVQTNINSFGADTVAGCGTYSKLEGFAFLPVTCFTMALTTFVGQNLGAGQLKRTKKGAAFGIICCMITAELIGVLMVLFPRQLVGIFTGNAAAVEVGARQATVEALFYCFLAYSHCVAAIMRGAGKPGVPMVVMLVCWCIIRVSYISVMVPLVGQSWVVFSAYPLTWTLSSIVFLIYYHKVDWLHAFEAKKDRS